MFGQINGGKPFPFKYDRTNNVSLLSSYNFTQNKVLSFVFVLADGSLVTLPEGKQAGVMPPNYNLTTRYRSGEYIEDFQNQNIISNRNNYRLPLYHRLDVNYQTSKETKRKNRRTWIFSVYNIYNRQNPFFLFEESGKIKQFTLFPIIPSVGYKLEF